MTDRIPGAPGQYKASVTQEELQKLQSGEEFAITITRDDQPIVEGTPYSKAAVLPDALAQKLCPGQEDPTPADALWALHDRAIESEEYPGCYYCVVDGETEWLNPPMLPGVEYRTTERYDGEPVYVKRIDTERLKDNGTLETVISSGLTGLIHFEAYANGGTTLDPFPMFATDGKIMAIAYASGNKAVLTTFSNASGYYGRVFAKYIQ